jgi:hypothetical protein
VLIGAHEVVKADFLCQLCDSAELQSIKRAKPPMLGVPLDEILGSALVRPEKVLDNDSLALNIGRKALLKKFVIGLVDLTVANFLAEY